MTAKGFDNVDLDACKQHEITVTRVPGNFVKIPLNMISLFSQCCSRVCHHLNASSKSENPQGNLSHVFLNMKAYNRVRDFNFSLTDLVGFDMKDKTAGLLGAGKIGKIVAKILLAFGCNVLVYDIQQDEGS